MRAAWSSGYYLGLRWLLCLVLHTREQVRIPIGEPNPQSLFSDAQCSIPSLGKSGGLQKEGHPAWKLDHINARVTICCGPPIGISRKVKIAQIHCVLHSIQTGGHRSWSNDKQTSNIIVICSLSLMISPLLRHNFLLSSKTVFIFSIQTASTGPSNMYLENKYIEIGWVEFA